MGKLFEPDLNILAAKNETENQLDENSFRNIANGPDYLLTPKTDPNLFRSLPKPKSRPLRWG